MSREPDDAEATTDGAGNPAPRTGELLGRALAANASGTSGASGASGAASGGGFWQAPAAEVLRDVFPGLRVLALAGRGGMGAVYRAEQTRLGRSVAVKILPPGATADPLARERFEREARVLSGLNHPHVLQIYDFGLLPDGTSYLVTEWAEGGDLAAHGGGTAVEPARVLAWVRQIADALDAAHARGVVHRDLKPANVLVRADGRLALADFGLAHATGVGFTTTLTLSGTIFGTFDYMAPEQMTERPLITPATDVYALGVLTYQLLTGRVPKGAYPRPSRVAKVPVEVDALIDSALANDPEQRPGSAGEFARRLGRAIAPRRSNLCWIVPLGALAVVLALYARSRPPSDRAAAIETRDAGAGEGTGTGRTIPADAPVGPVATDAAVTAGDAPVAAVVVADVADDVAREATTFPVAVEEPKPKPEPAGPAAKPAAAPAERPWAWLLLKVRPSEMTANGEWRLRGGELVSGAGVCALRLPVRVSPNFHYDVAVEFTRTGGVNSVGVFLPTAAGTGVFELDAWDAGLGGLQMIDGKDMRAHGEKFLVRLVNGEKQQLILRVRGERVEAVLNGVVRKSWDLAGRRLENNWLWEAGADMGLGLCSWKSPTIFHRVAYREVAE